MNKSKSSLTGRLFRYALLYKKTIIIALLILVAATGAQLAGPYIAKIIIDQHIQGIEKPWYSADPETVPEGIQSVRYQDRAFVRSDWLKSGQQIPDSWEKASISVIGASFYLIVGEIPEGAVWNVVSDETVEISTDGVTESYSAAKLGKDDIARFYSFDFKPVLWLIGLYIILLLAASGFTFIQSYLLQTAALGIIQKMRTDVMNHIQRIPIRYFDNTPIGAVVSRIANDTEAIKELFMSFMATFVVSGVNMIGIIVALFLLDTKLAFITLLLIPVFVVIMAVHLRFSKVYVTIMRARLSDMNAKLNESIHVMPIIQAFRREKKTIEEFETLNEDRYVNQKKQFRVFSLSSRNAVGLIISLVTAGVIWKFGGDSLRAVISFGVLYAFIDYLSRFAQPIIGIFDQLLNAQRAFVSAERVFHLMDQPAENEIVETSKETIRRPEGHVQFDGVSFAYNGDDYVLKNITFEANKGETVALVGHTGSGKSSIMNLLLGFYETSLGAIRIDGRDIRDYSKQELRKHMGIVLQDPFLFTGDIKFNVSLYDPTIGPEQVKKALRDVGAASFVEQLPQAYDTPVVERGSTLSAGQRQLISFARALAYNPAILILDEATASIDSETEGLIQQALKVLSKGRTTFIIAHRLSTIKEADQILVLHRGEIVERGTHEELMQKQGRYFRMYQLQTGETAAGSA
ncbi:ABC transporter ATP-binding protein [Paenibacillus sp. J2TS4]|uniref:ABC transporter ATP-binding protein n=1 Tax=Paenibacillus sp. J2TS4 TaxID=2807194 RepID=UPI001B14F79D|nr:putative multidrug resistance ABC transporter ATP-binding/permease protein YheH [Paenibacillus sp. J2TS4]